MKTLEIYRDSDPINPRTEYDCLGTLYIPASNRYISGDKEAHDPGSDFDGIALAVYAYIHGGIKIRCNPFSCQFDSGQVGVIYVSREKIKSEGIDDAAAKKILESEIDLYNLYLNGEVYGFIFHDENNEEINSCWGFFGSDYRTNGILDHVNLSPGDCIVEMQAITKRVTVYEKNILEVIKEEKK